MQLSLHARPSSDAQHEAALVDAARAGDDRAFEQLYARYRERIQGFVFSRVRDHGRAEDIAQETFMSALRQLRSTDREINFKPWLYTIARNACIDDFRRDARGRELPVESEEALGGARRPMLAAVPTPASAVESKQSLDDLRGAFGGLTEVQHRLLVMRELEGLTYDEIGTRLDMTRQMVESGLFRARRKLTEEYEELASGRRCAEIQTAVDAGRLVSARALGIKERRRYARHLSHCQPCRHVATMAGVDDSLLRPRTIAEKIAAVLPIPILRWLFSRGGVGHGGGAAGAGAAGSTAAGGSAIGLGQAASVATLALAGVGGGVVAAHSDHHRSGAVAHHAVAAARAQRVANVTSGHVVSRGAPGTRRASGQDRRAATAGRQTERAARSAAASVGDVTAPASDGVGVTAPAGGSGVSSGPSGAGHHRTVSPRGRPITVPIRSRVPTTTDPTVSTPTSTQPTRTQPTQTTTDTTRTTDTTISTPVTSTPVTTAPVRTVAGGVATTADGVATTAGGAVTSVGGAVGDAGGTVSGLGGAVGGALPAGSGTSVGGLTGAVGSAVSGAGGAMTGLGTAVDGLGGLGGALGGS